MAKSCEPNDYPQFGRLPSETIKRKIAMLESWIWKSKAEIPRNKLAVTESCILNIIDLVERRRVYFHVFHGVNMSEWNEIALYCFWIAKLHPFFEVLPSGKTARAANEINAIIAVRLLYNSVNKIRRSKGKGSVGNPCVSNFIHSFRYRDMSKESIMAMFEALIAK
jgi:hypothetical protein